jgi:manganese oxidase
MLLPSRAVLLLVVLALLASACAAGPRPRWTPTPASPTAQPQAQSPEAPAGSPAQPQAPSPEPQSPATEAPAGQTAEPANSPAAPGEAQGRLEFRAYDLGFEPANVSVDQPGTYEIVLVNDGVIPHDITFSDGTLIFASGGQTATGEVFIPAEGLEFICSIVGHADAGMTGQVTVTDGSTGGEPGAPQSPGAHETPGGHEPPEMTAEEMRDMDAARTALFPAETEGKGGVLLEPTITDDGVKEWELTASAFDWEIEPGVTVKAMGYNGVVPGPELRAELGDRVRVILHNELEEPTTIHFHGLLLPADMDGVPVISQPAVLPGESFTYEFEVRNTGSHMYHSHFMAAHQVPMGLLGAFVVEDPDDPAVDVDYVMVLNDGPLGYTLNGKSFPATEPIVAGLGQKVRIRYMNEGFQIHPMHLHGIPQQIVARDGYAVPAPYFEDTVLVSPGERVDVIVDATEPGVWAFHCHVLTHAESDEGMFGMVTALIVEE